MRLYLKMEINILSTSNLLKIEKICELSTSQQLYKRGATILPGLKLRVFDNDSRDENTSSIEMEKEEN